jgi:pyruvate/2-oxoglutarate dehydrogenase complex dihydrolipoamide dehydrogenase (E3) component
VKEFTKEHYDAIIIGVGQAGKPLALALSEKGSKVAIIERYLVGGSCINYGCTPTKTLVASAKAAYEARRAFEYGIKTGDIHVDYTAVRKRKDKVVEQFRKRVKKGLDEAEGITLLCGEASFTGPRQVRVALNDEGGERILTADWVFINTGTSARIPDLDGLENTKWLTSTSLLDLEELPDHLLILGGGYIGLEFGQMYRRFGSKVTIIERGDQLLKREDKDIASEVASFLEEEGITIHLNSEAEKISTSSRGLTLVYDKDDKPHEVTGSHLLIAIGNTPNTKVLNLEAAGIETNDKGYIQVNDRLETSQPGVYALGDVKGGPKFTHVSYDDYRVVKQNLLVDGKATISDRKVPYTVFTDPQLGRIGLSEKQAKEQNIAVKIASMPMSSVARAIETSRTNGLMKVVIDAKTDQILGAAILGMEGGEIMSLLQVAMMGNLSYQRIRDGVFSHPTIAESLNNLFSTVE